MLTPKRDAKAAKRFFRRALQVILSREPRGVNVDKNADTSKVIAPRKTKEELPENVELWQNKYLNNFVEQDHRFIK